MNLERKKVSQYNSYPMMKNIIFSQVCQRVLGRTNIKNKNWTLLTTVEATVVHRGG